MPETGPERSPEATVAISRGELARLRISFLDMVKYADNLVTDLAIAKLALGSNEPVDDDQRLTARSQLVNMAPERDKEFIGKVFDLWHDHNLEIQQQVFEDVQQSPPTID